jgi:hypothetical protein
LTNQSSRTIYMRRLYLSGTVQRATTYAALIAVLMASICSLGSAPTKSPNQRRYATQINLTALIGPRSMTPDSAGGKWAHPGF